MAASPNDTKRGTVYVTLGRMANKGYIESRRVPMAEGMGGLPRLFRAMGHGARVYHPWEMANAAYEFGG